MARREELLDAHYRKFWQPAGRTMHWLEGPIETLPHGFGVRPYACNGAFILATTGMTQPEWSPALELHFRLPRHYASADASALTPFMELLTVTAWFHNTQARLDQGHTVNFGRPVADRSVLTHGLLSLPYCDGPTLEQLKDPPTRCLWLLPITEQERDFKRDHGLEALKALFESEQINYLDLQRRSLV